MTSDPASNRANKQRRRRVVLAYYSRMGHPACWDCGLAAESLLTVDHVAGDGAAFRRRTGATGNSLVDWLLRHDLPEGFQTVCHNDQHQRRMRDPVTRGGSGTRLARAARAALARSGRKVDIEGDSSLQRGSVGMSTLVTVWPGWLRA